MSWNDDIEFVRNLCNQIEQSDTYTGVYDSTPDSDYEADREYVAQALSSQFIEDNDRSRRPA
jgi:N utilization substance protein B